MGACPENSKNYIFENERGNTMAVKMLEGIKVVELGVIVSGPIVGRELADLGAEVIKVEAPSGDIYRNRTGRLFELPCNEEDDPLFSGYNCNKRSLCLDLKKEGALDAFYKMLEGTDIFVTNFRENALTKLGLNFDLLHEKFPRLIIGGISGFGLVGPDKDRAGYDATSFWSPCGALVEWNYKESDTMLKPFYGFGDGYTASQLIIGLLSALYQRQITGKGDIVRSSLLATGLWANIGGLIRYQNGIQFPKSFYSPTFPLDNFYKTKDGRWLMASEDRWDLRGKYYLELMGAPELIDDPNWNSQAAYLDPATKAEKVQFFKDHIAQLTSEEISKAFDAMGAVYNFLYETDDVLKNEQAKANKMFNEIDTICGRPMTVSNIPISFASQGDPGEITRSRRLGEDSIEIMKELGYDDDAVESMLNSGVIVCNKG